jgi:translation elongation factor EF-Ts
MVKKMEKKITVAEVKALRDATGNGLADCCAAIRYKREHKGCTAVGYLKAKGIAVVRRHESFEERVRHFSNPKKDVL